LDIKRNLYTDLCTDQTKHKILFDEIPFIHAIAISAASQITEDNDYVKKFFLSDFVTGPVKEEFLPSLTAVYNSIADVAETLELSIPIYCVNDDVCKGPSAPIAYVDEGQTKINLCDKWFDDSQTATR
jgi:hypothetical protein